MPAPRRLSPPSAHPRMSGAYSEYGISNDWFSADTTAAAGDQAACDQPEATPMEAENVSADAEEDRFIIPKRKGKEPETSENMDKAPKAKKQKAFRPTISDTPVPGEDAKKKPIMPSSMEEFQKAKEQEDAQRK